MQDCGCHTWRRKGRSPSPGWTGTGGIGGTGVDRSTGGHPRSDLVDGNCTRSTGNCAGGMLGGRGVGRARTGAGTWTWTRTWTWTGARTGVGTGVGVLPLN